MPVAVVGARLKVPNTKSSTSWLNCRSAGDARAAWRQPMKTATPTAKPNDLRFFIPAPLINPRGFRPAPLLKVVKILEATAHVQREQEECNASSASAPV